MRTLTVVAMLLALTACARPQVVHVDGREYRAQVSRNTLVEVRPDGTMIVDRRGKSALEDLVKLYGLSVIEGD